MPAVANPRPSFPLGLCLRAAFLLPIALLAACSGDSERDDNALAALDERLTRTETPGAEDKRGVDGADLAARSKAGQQEAMKRLSSASGRTIDNCGQQVAMGREWADRMPAAFRLYPGAHLTEAAGVTNGRCALSVISFTTEAAPGRVIEHYQASARKAGFDAEHILCEGEHRLGGTRERDDAAYILFVRDRKTGGSTVDIVATAGAV